MQRDCERERYSRRRKEAREEGSCEREMGESGVFEREQGEIERVQREG